MKLLTQHVSAIDNSHFQREPLYTKDVLSTVKTCLE